MITLAGPARILSILNPIKMYKLNLAITALLCLALISCEKENLDLSDGSEVLITARSVDNVLVSYDTPTVSGQTTTCNLVEVYFQTATWADLVLTDASTTLQLQAKNISIVPISGDELLAKDPNGSEYYSYSFIVDPCNNALCLDDGANVFSGPSFIIEDSLEGF